ncbi:MAG: hypothetical protein M1826_005517 [Phylliscum demangeonii]|nr:MAG: hypothetical protein M1826_005517 [Phylliscum demangeonii]
MANPAIDIASAIQSASIKTHPSPELDINPSTAADTIIPLTAASSEEPSGSVHDDVDDEMRAFGLQPTPRRRTRPRVPPLPPLPDLRFEQSYLASISGAQTTGRVLWITFRDQVCFPLVQGTLWTLALHGWRYWNRTASYSGSTLGSRIRLWWYGVNKWNVPVEMPLSPAKKLAGEVEEFYKGQFASAGID